MIIDSRKKNYIFFNFDVVVLIKKLLWTQNVFLIRIQIFFPPRIKYLLRTKIYFVYKNNFFKTPESDNALLSNTLALSEIFFVLALALNASVKRSIQCHALDFCR